MYIIMFMCHVEGIEYQRQLQPRVGWGEVVREGGKREREGELSR